jgi:hypothetical protein
MALAVGAARQLCNTSRLPPSKPASTGHFQHCECAAHADIRPPFERAAAEWRALPSPRRPCARAEQALVFYAKDMAIRYNKSTGAASWPPQPA